MSSGPALAMPGKAQHFQGPQVSCCAKYLLFASNVLFWVGERELASESRPAEAGGRSVGGRAEWRLHRFYLGGGEARANGGVTGLWRSTSVPFATKSGVRGPGREGGRCLPGNREGELSPSPSCGILQGLVTRGGCSRRPDGPARRVERDGLGARKFLGKDVLGSTKPLAAPPGRCLKTGRCLAPSLCSYFSFSAVSSRIRKGFPIIKYVTFACLFFLTQQPFLLSPSSGGKSYYCILQGASSFDSLLA